MTPKNTAGKPAGLRVATDVGGTFTDIVVFDPAAGTLTSAKVDTTPPAFERGVLASMDKAGVDPQALAYFAHGSTVVINALTERKGARTALITTAGFRDVLEIGRGNRPDLFNFRFAKPVPFVPRHLRRELRERLDLQGGVVTPLDLGPLPAMLADFRADGVEAIAICLLHAYANPAHEIAVRDAVRAAWPGVAVVASHEISGEWREYERTSTTVLSAYVKPVADGYLRRLQDGLATRGSPVAPFIMLSNGGIATVEGARANPVAMVESGPASGVLGGAALAQQLGINRAIVLDIGGTTAKCGLVIDGQPQISTEYHIERSRIHPGYPIQTAVVDIVEIGNGGGSIAWLDEGGKLRVGPRSAGAVPGPAAYGRGGQQLTTTDANLLLGRIDPAHFLGGEQAPDMPAVIGAATVLAEALHTSVPDIARGIVRIANANMVNALKLISTNKGWDTRDFTLIAIGGGGAMHAVALAQELRIPRVIVPRDAGVFSAWGMLMTDLRRDYLQTRLTALDAGAAGAVASARTTLDARARADYTADGLGGEAVDSELFGDLRYAGQEHTVKVRIGFAADGTPDLAGLLEAFHAAHERAYTYRLEAKVELVNFHLVARVRVPRPPMPKRPVTGRTFESAVRERRVVDFDAEGVLESLIVERDRLEPGMAFTGPAVIAEDATTTAVGPGHRVTVDDYGHLHVQLHFAP